MSAGTLPESRPPTGRILRVAVSLAFLTYCLVGCHYASRDIPPGLSFAGSPKGAGRIEFLRDVTWTDPAGHRVVDQQIFDALARVINSARRLVVLDMFLFNDFAGRSDSAGRRLSHELTELLVNRRTGIPELRVVLITDPINSFYGGIPEPAHLRRLREAGVTVVTTDLDRLRDSNPVYSAAWRIFVRPLGVSPARTVPNPLDSGRVSMRAFLKMLNFKANHRKVLVADDGNGGLVGLVTSANPHDASSLHGNVGVLFDGPAASDLLDSERAVIAFSGGPDPGPFQVPAVTGSVQQVSVLTEGRIKRSVIRTLDRCGPGDSVDLLMFYLSERDVIHALVNARARGAEVRVLLDPNKDAFGRTKNGIPNRPVAVELRRGGVSIRWCDTRGEQAHSKMLLCRFGDGDCVMILGSANLTRRNICDFNLETDAMIEASIRSEGVRLASEHFEALWNNHGGRTLSLDFAEYAEPSAFKAVAYRIAEFTGMCTF